MGCTSVQTGELRGCFMRENIIGNSLEESPFYSIPQAIWWVFTTITTVGYGDIYPTSWMGKVVAIITMHVGILGLALPISIIGTNFREIFNVRQQQKLDLKMKNMLAAKSTDLQLMDNMNHTLRSIVIQVNTLQTMMNHYEHSMKEREVSKGSALVEDTRGSLNRFVDKLKSRQKVLKQNSNSISEHDEEQRKKLKGSFEIQQIVYKDFEDDDEIKL